MYKVLESSLQEIALLTFDVNRSYKSEDEALKQEAKAIRSVESILGRELLRFLTHHNCERGCDSFVLSFAEELATKRPYNPHALDFFIKQVRVPFGSPLASSVVYQAFMYSSPKTTFAQWYVREWLKEFQELGVKVLHGEVDASEAFGDGYFFEMWEEFVKQVSVLNANDEVERS